MTETRRAREVIHALFQGQKTAFLSTQRDGRPYANIVAFVAGDDLRRLLFATERATRKFENLARCPHVALLITNAMNREEDFRDAAAVTVTGRGEEVDGDEKQALLPFYAARHPSLEEFVRSPDCALIRVNVETCVLVERFRDVSVLRINDLAPNV